MANVHDRAVIYQGDDVVIEGDLHQVDGSPLDLSQGVPAITWRVSAPDGSIAFNYSLGSGITITDAVNGKITILVPRAQTLGLVPGTYRDQLVATVSGVAETQWFGTLDVRASI